MEFINDKDYESVSSIAIVTSYPRIFTDIEYEKDIYNWLSSHCNEEVTLNKKLAPEIEVRYKLINKLLDKSKTKQVLELAAGYTSRGLIYSKKGYNYVEIDLEKVVNNKQKIINSLVKDIPIGFCGVHTDYLENLNFYSEVGASYISCGSVYLNCLIKEIEKLDFNKKQEKYREFSHILKKVISIKNNQ